MPGAARRCSGCCRTRGSTRGRCTSGSATSSPRSTRRITGRRSLIGRALTPKQVERVRPDIIEIAHDLLDDLAIRSGADEVDLRSTAFRNQLPLTVLCRMLGVSPADQAVVEQWTVTVGLAFSPYLAPDLRATIERAITEFDEYSSEMIDRRLLPQPRRRPVERLPVHAEAAGDRLSRCRAPGAHHQPVVRRSRHHA